MFVCPQVIGTTNKHVGKVAKFIAKYADMLLFPVKVQVPLLLSVYAVLVIKHFHVLPTETPDRGLGQGFFEVPVDATRKALADVMEGPSRGGRHGKGRHSVSENARDRDNDVDGLADLDNEDIQF